MAVTDFSLAHTPGGSEVFGGVMIPDPASSAGDTLQSTGVAGAPAEWAAGGGSLPDPITTTVNINTSDAGTGALSIIPGAFSNAISVSELSHDGSSAFLLLTNDSGQVLQISDAGGATWNLFAGASFTLADAAMNGVFSVNSLGRMGFFGNSPVDQPAVPTTLGDVIAGLQALGLFAS